MKNKIKTHSGAKKRFKIKFSNGEPKFYCKGGSHHRKLLKKSKSNRNSDFKLKSVHKTNIKRLRKMLVI